MLHVIHGNNYCEGLENANIILFLNKCHGNQLKRLNLQQKSYYFPNFLESISDYEKTKKIKNIGIIGRFSEEKNFETVINSMKYLEDYKLIIAGAGSYEEKYKNLIKKLNLNNIEFLGWVESDDFFKKIDLMVMSSFYESFGLVSLESISKSKIIISSKNEGSLQIFDDLNKTIFVDNVTDSFEYAEKIKYFTKNIDLVNKITKENHNYLIKNFSLDILKDKLSSIDKFI